MSSLPDIEQTDFGARITVGTFDKLIEVLSPNYYFWQYTGYKNWIYRGHCNSDWKLFPTTFRNDTDWELLPKGKVKYKEIWYQKIIKERNALRSFAILADRAGLELPIDGFDEFLNYCFDESEFKGTDNYLKEIWRSYPKKEHLRLLALAQHHGVPTRLLDFTNDPFKSLFFAVEPNPKDNGEPEFSCIWIFHKMKFNKHTRFKILNISNYENKYLYKQEGLFILDTEANDFFEKNEKLTDMVDYFEKMHLEEKSKWGEDFEVRPDHFPCVQILFPIELRDEILRHLEELNINKAILMPTYENVFKTLKFSVNNGIHIYD